MHLRPTRTTGPTSAGRARRLAALLAAGALAGCGGAGAASTPASGSGQLAAASQQTTTTAAPPLRLVSSSPATGAALPSTSAPISITFTAPLAEGAPDPVVAPATPGQWARSGATLTFTPTGEYAPFTPLTVTVPAGERAQGASPSDVATTLGFTTPAPSMKRYQQLLAELQYIPFNFTPAGAAAPLVASAAPTAAPATTAPATATPGAVAASPPPATPAATATASPVAVAVADQPGALTWRYPSVPAALGAAWGEGKPNLVTKGAVMAFEADHHLTIDGLVGPSVWGALVAAVQAGSVDPRPYDFISVSEASPETLTVWQAGANVYSTLANTGVPGAVTDKGTFPVYERFTTTTMSGKNPDGSTYHDPGIPWVAYFNGGDAIHGFVRPGYGYPQSDGCVELPPAHAQAVYPMDYYGTLVSVQ